MTASPKIVWTFHWRFGWNFFNSFQAHINIAHFETSIAHYREWHVICIIILFKWFDKCHFIVGRRNCGRLLIRMTRFSMQIKMLDIICSYLYGEHLQRPDPLVRAHIFISLFHGNTVFSVDVKKEITKILDTKAEISFKDKHHLLSLINSSNTNRSVFSMPITILKPISLNNKTQPVNWNIQ